MSVSVNAVWWYNRRTSEFSPHPTSPGDFAMLRRSQALGRRTFLGWSTAAAVTVAAPRVLTASRTNAETIVGEGAYQYRAKHNWAQLPDKFSWQTTHNVAVDRAGNLYVIHEGRGDLQDHPSIFVFDPEGRYIRSFGSQFQGGGHGIEVRQEGSEEFLYVCAYQRIKSFAKLTLTGETVWQQYAPMESGKYAEGEAALAREGKIKQENAWGRDKFLPTNFAFLDDGGFLLADGYGANLIHRYDKDGKWQSCFGGVGQGEGTFNTAHGLWIDRRGAEPVIVVTDRAHHTLQRFKMDGTYIDTLSGFGLPANIDSHGDLLLVPELRARVTLLGKDNQVVAHLGGDAQRLDEVQNLRGKPEQWLDGKFVHPHDACFAADGSIFVAEWVATGRITKLEKI
jgi:hypothetical protein